MRYSMLRASNFPLGLAGVVACDKKAGPDYKPGEKIFDCGVAISDFLANTSYWCGIGIRNTRIPGMARELDRMSYKDLQELELKLKKAKASAQERSRVDLREKVEAMVAAAGFKMSDIFGGRGGKGRKVAAKYVNPDDPSETWTGRGRKPRWLAAKLKDGERIDKFLIK
jgi:DNA-binding protein H-NS